MFTGIPFIDLLIVEALMLASGVLGWFLHSSWATNALTKIEDAIKKVTESAPAQ